MNFDFSVIVSNLPALVRALGVTILISLGGIGLGTLVGVGLGVCSLLPSKLIRLPSRVIIEAFLALPVLVLLVWLYYSLPLIIPGLSLAAKTVAVLGLGLSLSAFVAEIVRGGISAVPSGELEVAYLSGLTRFQAIRHILLPQVFRKSWPPLMGQYITLYKFSTLASVIAVPEILHTANLIILRTYRPIEIYTFVALLFIITVTPINILLRRIERSERLGGTHRL